MTLKVVTGHQLSHYSAPDWGVQSPASLKTLFHPGSVPLSTYKDLSVSTCEFLTVLSV